MFWCPDVRYQITYSNKELDFPTHTFLRLLETTYPLLDNATCYKELFGCIDQFAFQYYHETSDFSRLTARFSSIGFFRVRNVKAVLGKHTVIFKTIMLLC